MYHKERQLRAKIVSELVVVLFHLDLQEMSLQTTVNDEVFTVCLTASAPTPPKDLLSLMEFINNNQHLPTDYYYQELLGTRDDEPEKEILAALLSEASWQQGDGFFTLCLRRDPHQDVQR
ncbi:hypothetical protein ABB02_00870 [Clostridiaceae bacterium JG1575]|nr:hypothetical protein ABB02_00870 [Clostridiaceae bacterium JG1575]